PAPRRPQRLDAQWTRRRPRDLDPTLGRLDVLEHRAALERNDSDVDAGNAEEIELGRRRRPVVRPDECRGSQTEPGDGQGRVGHSAAEPPAATVIRGNVIGSFEHDTLIEAIADELERNHGFISISDDRLTAAVNVSRDPEQTFLADLEAEDEDESDDEETVDDTDFRTIVADFNSKP